MFARNFIRAFINVNTNQNSYNSHQHLSNIANNYNIDIDKNKERFDLINRNNFLLTNSKIEPILVKKEDVNITFKLELDFDGDTDLLRQSLYEKRNFE